MPTVHVAAHFPITCPGARTAPIVRHVLESRRDVFFPWTILCRKQIIALRPQGRRGGGSYLLGRADEAGI